MYPVKKITKEDTWRSDDLKVHIEAHSEESKRRSKREEEHRKYRDGESLDRRHRDPDRDARREKEKQRERESTREKSKHRDPDRDRNQDDKLQDIREDRYKERKRERERDNRHRDGDEEEKRHNRGEKENSERRRDREKDRYKDRDVDMYNQWDRGTNREGEKDRDRRRAERDRERKSETDRRKEERREGEKDERERDKERERERRERHRARESEQHRHEYEEKQREGERRERRSDKEHSGHREKEHRRDREDREKRRRDKESHVAHTSHSREVEQHHQEWKESRDYFHGIKNGDREKAREREERDKRREKRHKEASESKRSDRERKHKDSSGHDLSERINTDKEEPTKIPQLTWRSIQAEMSDPEIPVENEETEENKQASKDHNDYEEDFEDYEEDFEDVDEEEDDNEEEEKEEHDKKLREDKRELSPKRREEIEAIQRAIDEENERIYSARSKPTSAESAVTQRERHSDRSRAHGKIIDFVSAKQREVSQKVAKKQKKRSEELLRLIDLDFSITFSLLDLPPVNEYDMYIKNFGTANTKQAYVQCNEDNTDRDIQTEEVNMTDKWTQHPPEANAACGGSKATEDSADESTSRINTNSQRLTTFLRSAAQVMAVLIEENMAESNSVRRLRSQTDALSFSDGCIQLNTKLPFLHGRQVSLLQFSQVQRQTLLSVHPPSSKSSAVRLDGETIICVWNIWEPSRPQKILLYESEVRCCCFSPGKVTLVFAGTEIGSVVVWDLREHSGTHLNLVVGKEVWTLCYPTFSTDAVLSVVGHLSPVVSIEPVLATADTSSKSTLTADIDESLGLSFQLGSLDENGVLTLWVVVELQKGNDSGSQTDLGLRPGGKVKLLHSSSLQTTEKSPQDVIMGFGPPVSLQLKFLLSDSNHYFIGTNMGLVRHGTRHSLKVLPKFYRSQFDSCRPVEVTALDFSPSGEPLFLVGCSDGTVRLHSVLREDPLMEWSGCSSGASILSVQWSQTRSAVFCVLDAASDLHIWDLTVKDYVPFVTENIHNDRVTAMAVFGEPAKQNTFSGVALAKQSGKVEIQYFKESLTVPSAYDKEKLKSFLHDALMI
ncbi:WD repeat-containing protein 60-like [Sinocyclocheilus rhinocerous]|uniref:WD repeat-containing protein 60-like n=1 Tax=Sinocyclocheilus rhinocerous TaxID=307959 RepID=UPI0007B9F3D5|nr:PREDICTED: WD repeat-containing protein 60-like [Sinocyclocheilus rhinocerous]